MVETIGETVTIISTTITGIAIPVLVFLFARLDKREKIRAAAVALNNESRQEFISLMLWGIKAVGELAKANAIAYKRGFPNGELDSAIIEYGMYCKNLEKYQNKKTGSVIK